MFKKYPFDYQLKSKSLRSFISYCIKRDVQPLMHTVEKDTGFLYVDCGSFCIRGPLLLKKNLEYIWNQIGIYRFRVRESFQLMQINDANFRED